MEPEPAEGAVFLEGAADPSSQPPNLREPAAEQLIGAASPEQLASDPPQWQGAHLTPKEQPMSEPVTGQADSILPPTVSVPTVIPDGIAPVSNPSEPPAVQQPAPAPAVSVDHPLAGDHWHSDTPDPSVTPVWVDLTKGGSQ